MRFHTTALLAAIVLALAGQTGSDTQQHKSKLTAVSMSTGQRFAGLLMVTLWTLILTWGSTSGCAMSTCGFMG